jgi:hypothetical protein
MKLTLPQSGSVVELHDFVPQIVFERFQEMISKNIKFDMKIANVDITRVAEELGPDRAFAIQNAEEGQRKLLMDEARKEIIMKHVNAEISVADTHAAERTKIAGMVLSIDDDDSDIEKRLGLLSRRDYSAIQEEVKKIEAKDEEELGKSNGQSAA